MHPSDFNRALRESNWFNALNPSKETDMTNEQQPADQGRGVGELPELPKAHGSLNWTDSGEHCLKTGYTAEQMQEYARAAIAALTQPKGSADYQLLRQVYAVLQRYDGDDDDFRTVCNRVFAALSLPRQSEAEPFGYACPANCGCMWRDNGADDIGERSMSLFGPKSRSCEVCEPLPLASLIPLYTTPQAADDEADDLLRKLGLSPDQFRTEGGAINHMKVRAAIQHPAEYTTPQPAQVEDDDDSEPCPKCLLSFSHDPACPYLGHTFGKQPAQADTTAGDGWISVEDRLPDEDCAVMTFGAKNLLEGAVMFRSFTGYGTMAWFCISPQENIQSYSPTHWRTLPEPPVQAASAPGGAKAS